MLSFKKGNYTAPEVLVLRKALNRAYASIKCGYDDCDTCPSRRPCGDLTRLIKYLVELALSMEQIPNTENQSI